MAAPLRIAVFRALQLGDMLAAVPALRALRAWRPDAHLTLIALPWARELFARYRWLDDVLPFPGHPDLPERSASLRELADFHALARAQRFDLAVQLHGSGTLTNAWVAQLGARQCAGFHPAGSPNPDPAHFIAWPARGREVERLLALPRHLGAPPVPAQLELPVLEADRARLHALWSPARGRRRVVIHPGARLPSRRWPAERFAAVAQALCGIGCQVVLTGSAAEADTLDAFRRSAPREVFDLSERTDLGSLAALIDEADLLVCNDTGVSHIAAARGTPSVVVSCGADAARWAPGDGRRHVVLAAEVACRPCMAQRCPTAHECARAIDVGAVTRAARRLLETEFSRAA